jgi:hypothetical protein
MSRMFDIGRASGHRATGTGPANAGNHGPTRGNQGERMAFTEKSNWVVVVVSVVTMALYAAMVVPPALGRPVSQVGYEQPILATIVVFIIANILGNIVAAASNPEECDKKDQRDTEIDRFGGRVGNTLLLVGACAAMFLAMAKQDYFWIANAVYVGGLLASLVGSVVKIAAYHGPFQRWLSW